MATGLDRLGGEVVRLRSRDGVRLAGRWLAAEPGEGWKPDPREAILLLHGWSGSVTPDLLEVGPFLRRTASACWASTSGVTAGRRRAHQLRAQRGRGRGGCARLAGRAGDPARRPRRLVHGRHHGDRGGGGPGRRAPRHGGCGPAAPAGARGRAAAADRRRDRRLGHARARARGRSTACGSRSGAGSRTMPSRGWPADVGGDPRDTAADRRHRAPRGPAAPPGPRHRGPDDSHAGRRTDWSPRRRRGAVVS